MTVLLLPACFDTFGKLKLSCQKLITTKRLTEMYIALHIKIPIIVKLKRYM